MSPLGVGPDKLPAILDWIQKVGWQSLINSPVEFVAQNLVLPCTDPQSGIRVDFIFSFSPFERQAIERANLKKLGDQVVRFAAVEDLVVLKTISGRPRDMEDIHSIFLKKALFDVQYVRRWLHELQLGQDEDYLGRFEESWSRAHQS